MSTFLAFTPCTSWRIISIVLGSVLLWVGVPSPKSLITINNVQPVDQHSTSSSRIKLLLLKSLVLSCLSYSLSLPFLLAVSVAILKEGKKWTSIFYLKIKDHENIYKKIFYFSINYIIFYNKS